jgi:hypothetical protein
MKVTLHVEDLISELKNKKDNSKQNIFGYVRDVVSIVACVGKLLVKV